jgi:hypothetical protein
MDGQANNKEEVICCFCGKNLPISEAAILSIQPNILQDECQQFFCHRFHVVDLIDKSIPLHPEFYDN